MNAFLKKKSITENTICIFSHCAFVAIWLREFCIRNYSTHFSFTNIVIFDNKDIIRGPISVVYVPGQTLKIGHALYAGRQTFVAFISGKFAVTFC